MMLVVALLIAAASAGDCDDKCNLGNCPPCDVGSILAVAGRHDYDFVAGDSSEICSQIASSGRCGEMVQMNTKMGGDFCTTECDGVAAAEKGCFTVHTDAQCTSTGVYHFIPFDNACHPHPDPAVLVYVNLMQNFICGNEVACNAASATGEFPLHPVFGKPLCRVGPDRNGAAIGTHTDTCSSLMNTGKFYKHAACSTSRRKL